MNSPRNSRKLRACAECRRLKLRCDRNFPCQACIRRGCSSICPDKCFTDKATPSSLKANTLRSREQIHSLEERITALENALAQECPSHPLISSESSPSLESAGKSDELLQEAADILGTLTIAEDGSTVFNDMTHSKSIQSSTCFPGPHLLSGADQPDLPNNIQLLSALFPFTPDSVATAASIDDFIPFIPAEEVVLNLITRYWYTFIAHPAISRDHFVKHVYGTFYPDQKSARRLQRADAHRLGLLFIALALHLLIDTVNPMLSMEAEKYHQLARAVLSLDPVCGNTTVPALQCMLFMSWYIRMAPTRASPGYDWPFQGITVKLASSIGIFRDSRRWISDPDEIAQREMLCWELICIEQWMAFFNGRPSGIDLSLVDCPRPTDTTIGSPGPGVFFSGYHSWKYSFYALINNVLLVVMRPRPVKYSEILALEQRLRDCVMPPGLEIPLNGSPLQGLPEDALPLHLQRFMALLIREMTACILHRRFLFMAMEKGSVNVQDIPFRDSVLRAGCSARWIVNSQIVMYRRHPKLISRAPVFWSASFSAAIILGAIAARYADRDFARSVLVPFENICALFVETAGISLQPPHALDSLKRLHKRVRSHFSHDSAEHQSSLNDRNPSLKTHISPPPVSEKPQAVTMTTISPSSCEYTETDSLALAQISSNRSMPIAEMFAAEGVIVDQTTVWPETDLQYILDETGSHVDTQKNNQELQSWPEVISATPSRNSIMGSSVSDFGQWDQFLDNLGVWD